jgi:hypothetical protein
MDEFFIAKAAEMILALTWVTVYDMVTNKMDDEMTTK